MIRKPIILSEVAVRDVDDAISYYLGEAGGDVASTFVDRLEQALEHIARHPESGSPRVGMELNLPGLRSWPVSAFPYLVFYKPRSGHKDVRRLLHGRRDMPRWMRGE